VCGFHYGSTPKTNNSIPLWEGFLWFVEMETIRGSAHFPQFLAFGFAAHFRIGFATHLNCSKPLMSG
jgi:hypothetical protein